MTLISTLLTAFMAGLLGSAHCFGMCGGIAAAIGTGSIEQGDTRWQAVRKALVFNGGRIFTYAILGAIVGTLVGSVGQIVGLKQWSFVLRLLTALMIFLIGLQYLTNKSYLGWLERGGGKVWQKISQLMRRNSVAKSPRNAIWSALRTGMLWGWLPCGLVYTILLTAAASGSTLSGAMIMFAFGVGTLPALTSLTVAGPLISQLRSSLQARRIIGLAMMIFALWIAAWAVIMHSNMGMAGHNHAGSGMQQNTEINQESVDHSSMGH